MIAERWTLVQHSAMGYKGDAGFARAVETRSVRTLAEQRRVLRAGGVLFATYGAADDAAEKVNYPPEVKGLYPRVRGSFAPEQVDGLRIYRPAEADSFPVLVGAST